MSKIEELETKVNKLSEQSKAILKESESCRKELEELTSDKAKIEEALSWLSYPKGQAPRSTLTDIVQHLVKNGLTVQEVRSMNLNDLHQLYAAGMRQELLKQMDSIAEKAELEQKINYKSIFKKYKTLLITGKQSASSSKVLGAGFNILESMHVSGEVKRSAYITSSAWNAGLFCDGHTRKRHPSKVLWNNGTVTDVFYTQNHNELRGHQHNLILYYDYSCIASQVLAVSEVNLRPEPAKKIIVDYNFADKTIQTLANREDTYTVFIN